MPIWLNIQLSLVWRKYFQYAILSWLDLETILVDLWSFIWKLVAGSAVWGGQAHGAGDWDTQGYRGVTDGRVRGLLGKAPGSISRVPLDFPARQDRQHCHNQNYNPVQDLLSLKTKQTINRSRNRNHYNCFLQFQIKNWSNLHYGFILLWLCEP